MCAIISHLANPQTLNSSSVRYRSTIRVYGCFWELSVLATTDKRDTLVQAMQRYIPNRRALIKYVRARCKRASPKGPRMQSSENFAQCEDKYSIERLAPSAILRETPRDLFGWLFQYRMLVAEYRCACSGTGPPPLFRLWVWWVGPRLTITSKTDPSEQYLSTQPVAVSTSLENSVLLSKLTAWAQCRHFSSWAPTNS